VVTTAALHTGEIWLVQLDPTVGSEIQKTRPCVLISPPEMLEHLRTVIVAPMTKVLGLLHFEFPSHSRESQGSFCWTKFEPLTNLDW